MEIKNYITPAGHQRMKDELLHLLDEERPEIVKIVSWAASNGDRSENGDYQYGKKRLREIDRRIYFLTKRLEDVLVVDPEARDQTDQIFFGATVCYADEAGQETTIAIVGVDEVNMEKNHVSWISPIAKVLIKAREGDTIKFQTPEGLKELDILKVIYQKLG
jgi:transcription elongation factor GreB